MQKASRRSGATFQLSFMTLLNYLYSTSWFLPVRITLSIFYSLTIKLRNVLYDLGVFKIYSVDIPVISVGNISLGGSGKTILVQALLEHFLADNKKPAVLSRGYARTTKGLFLVADETTILGDAFTSGDEPFLISQNYPGVPVLVSEDRVKGARFLLESFSLDLIILDDGFQHRRLHRDLDLLLLDQPKDQPGRLIPWGKMREGAESIRRADVVIFSKSGLGTNEKKNLTITLEDRVFDHAGKSISLDRLGGNYGLFAGLGNPASFFDSVQRIHHATENKIVFPDHTAYESSQLDRIQNRSCDYWITSQKDFVKLNATFCKKHAIYYIRAKARLPHTLESKLKQYFK